MKLLIDTTDAEVIKMKLDGKKYSLKVEKRSSQKLIPFINEVLEQNDLDISDIDELEVASGPGSYTGIRVGVSVAQTIAWFQDIKLNGKKVGEESIKINYD